MEQGPNLTIVALSILMPTLFWVGYHYYRDRRQPEPWQHTGLAFVLGIAAGALGQQCYLALASLGVWYDPVNLAETDLLALLLYSVAGIATIEELAKFVFFLPLIFWLPSFDEPVDGIIYAAFIALGFASFENYHYLGFLSTGEQLARGISGPLIHILFASLWGYPIGRAVVEKRPLLPAIVRGLVAAIFVHGIYDFLVFSMGTGTQLVAAGLILAVWLWRMYLIERVLPAQS